MERLGIAGLSNDVGFRVLGDVLRRPDLSTVGCQSSSWPQFWDRLGEVPKFFSLTSAANAVTDSVAVSCISAQLLAAMGAEKLREYVRDVVVETAQSVLAQSGSQSPAVSPLAGSPLSQADEPIEGRAPTIDLNTPLAESGLDSLGAVEFGNQLTQKLGVKMSATTLFDYPTLSAIIEYVYEQLSTEGGESAEDVTRVELFSGVTEEMRGLQSRMKTEREAAAYLAVVGAACRLPGGCDNIEQFWNMMTEGTDCMTEILLQRFNVDKCYDPDPERKGHTYVREAAFTKNPNLFDNSFFNISRAAELTVA
eukprot:Selendium_serpulae@DN6181_c2_g1_i1.p1